MEATTTATAISVVAIEAALYKAQVDPQGESPLR
eukprot:CAMPEP_0172831240 /NCGR_PEP_ID=MMETSP1075-20121228/22842_1 /TAXON_ID=2916 /ORGANISM="Ceratium fusus, Strain PA161109" /LENGTH=33 /DNA_ID= /DNA_START= /DNA_END= /DNA_ORIENTATION=